MLCNQYYCCKKFFVWLPNCVCKCAFLDSFRLYLLKTPIYCWMLFKGATYVKCFMLLLGFVENTQSMLFKSYLDKSSKVPNFTSGVFYTTSLSKVLVYIHVILMQIIIHFCRHLRNKQTTLEAMLRTKVSLMPGYIQSVFVQNIGRLEPFRFWLDAVELYLSAVFSELLLLAIYFLLLSALAKLYSQIMQEVEAEEDWDRSLSLDNLMISKLPQFELSENIEVQERVRIYRPFTMLTAFIRIFGSFYCSVTDCIYTVCNLRLARLFNYWKK